MGIVNFVKEFKKKELRGHIVWVLAILIPFIMAVEISETLRNNVFYPLIAVLLLIIGICFHKRRKFDVYIASYILIGFLLSRGLGQVLFTDLDETTLVLRTSAILAFTTLTIVLLIGPWSRWSLKVRKMYKRRRHLGVVAFFCAYFHAAIVIASYYNYSTEAMFSSVFVFYGVNTFIIMFWLAITSWDYLQENVKTIWWSILHVIILLGYIGMAIYTYRLQLQFQEPTLPIHLAVWIVLLVLWLLTAPYGVIKWIMKTPVFGWKQLHVLVHVGYLSILWHVFFGIVRFQGTVVISMFAVSPVLVYGSHAYGWLRKIGEDKRLKNRVNLIDKTTVSKGMKFIGVGRETEFQDGVGEKFILNDKGIAVFRHEGKYLAFSSVCHHQKGPLDQGKIRNGYLECPWHQHQFSVKDACGPPGFGDCVPFYATKVIEGIVFVSEKPIANDMEYYP